MPRKPRRVPYRQPRLRRGLTFQILTTHPLRFGKTCARCHEGRVTEWGGLYCGPCLTFFAEQRAATEGWPVVVHDNKVIPAEPCDQIAPPTPLERMKEWTLARQPVPKPRARPVGSSGSFRARS